MVALIFGSEMYVNIKLLLHMSDNPILKLCTLINLTVGLGWGKQYIWENFRAVWKPPFQVEEYVGDRLPKALVHFKLKSIERSNRAMVQSFDERKQLSGYWYIIYYKE